MKNIAAWCAALWLGLAAAQGSPTPQDDPAFAYTLFPKVQIACYGSSKRVGFTLENGPNLCAAFAVPAVPVADAQTITYFVTYYYLAPVGSIIDQRWEPRQTERVVKVDLKTAGLLAPAQIPVYVAEENLLDGLGRVWQKTYESVQENAVPALTAWAGLQALEPGLVMAGLSRFNLDSVGQALDESLQVVGDLLGGNNRIYSVTVYARICGASRCTRWGFAKVEKP